MSTPATIKQAARAIAIQQAAEQLKAGLTALMAIGYQETLDGVTLAGVDVSAVAVKSGATLVPTQGQAPLSNIATLGYTTGDQLQAVVAAAQQIQQFIAGTDVNGTQTSIGAAIAAVCGS